MLKKFPDICSFVIKKRVFWEIPVFLLLSIFLLGYCLTTSIKVETSSASPEKLSLWYNGHRLDSKFKTKRAGGVSYCFLSRYSTPVQISFSPDITGDSIERIKIRTGFSYYRISRDLIRSKMSSHKLCFGRSDFYKYIQNRLEIPSAWLVSAFIVLIVLFDILLRIGARLSSALRKPFRFFVFFNCFVILPLFVYWLFSLFGSHEYIRIVPEISSNQLLRLQLFYTFDEGDFSENASIRTSAMHWGHNQNLPAIIYLPREAFWPKFRLDFDTAQDDTVTIQKIEVFDRFDQYTIPGDKIPALLAACNKIKNISVNQGSALLTIQKSEDAYMVFDAAKIRKMILPHKCYPWKELIFFLAMEIFIVMSLLSFYPPVEKTRHSKAATLLGKVFFRYVLLLCLFISLSGVMSLMPRTLGLYHNMQKSALRAKREGLEFRVNGVRVNNFADISYYSIGYFAEPSHPLTSPMRCFRIGVEHPAPTDTFDWYLSGRRQNILGYFRYWMGSSYPLRFFSEFMTHREVRIIFSLINLGLIAILLYSSYRKLGLWPTLCLGLMLTSIAVFFVHMNQISYWPILIMLALCVYMLNKEDMRASDYTLAFFTAGAFVPFFDILSNPILALVVPGIVAAMIVFDKNKVFAWKDMFLHFLNINISWGAGFGMSWAAKWVIAILFIPGAFRNILKAFLFRVSPSDINAQKIDRFAGLIANYREFYDLNMPVIALGMILFAVMSIVTLYVIVKHKAAYSFPFALTVVGFGAIPVIWQIVTANHAYIHYWMTFRTLSGSFFAILLLAYAPLSAEKRKEFFSKFISSMGIFSHHKFVSIVAAAVVCMVATTVLTGALSVDSPPYRFSVILENSKGITIARNGLVGGKVRKYKDMTVGSRVGLDWKRCSFEILSDRDRTLKMKLGCLPFRSREGIKHYTVEYKRICINGEFYPERIHHGSAFPFPFIEVKLTKNVPVRVSFLVRMHPNFGNENE